MIAVIVWLQGLLTALTLHARVIDGSAGKLWGQFLPVSFTAKLVSTLLSLDWIYAYGR